MIGRCYCFRCLPPRASFAAVARAMLGAIGAAAVVAIAWSL